jgi:hypothetical protein
MAQQRCVINSDAQGKSDVCVCVCVCVCEGRLSATCQAIGARCLRAHRGMQAGVAHSLSLE